MTFSEYRDLVDKLASHAVAENADEIKKYICTIFSTEGDINRVKTKLCEIVCTDRLLLLAHRELFGDLISFQEEMDDGRVGSPDRLYMLFLKLPTADKFWSHNPATNLTHYLISNAVDFWVSNAKEEGDDGQ